MFLSCDWYTKCYNLPYVYSVYWKMASLARIFPIEKKNALTSPWQSRRVKMTTRLKETVFHFTHGWIFKTHFADEWLFIHTVWLSERDDIRNTLLSHSYSCRAWNTCTRLHTCSKHGPVYTSFRHRAPRAFIFAQRSCGHLLNVRRFVCFGFHQPLLCNIWFYKSYSSWDHFCCLRMNFLHLNHVLYSMLFHLFGVKMNVRHGRNLNLCNNWQSVDVVVVDGVVVFGCVLTVFIYYMWVLLY